MMEELRHLGILIEDEESAETVGVVVLNRLGRIPRIGDKVDLGPDGTAEITSVSRRRILRVRIRLQSPPQSRP
jgi:CBS domain containing-hemolysin-like protein